MNLKQLLKRLGWYGLIVAFLATAHVIFWQNVSLIAEWAFAPSYVPLADAVALADGKSNFEERIVEAERKKAEWTKCAAETEEYLVGSLCQYLVPEKVEQESDAELKADGHRIHRSQFIWKNVRPHVEKAEGAIDWIFGISYAVVALLFSLAIFKWLKFSALPMMRDGLKTASSAPVGKAFRDLNAARKLRKAESDFLTAKTLYENGLITEEMFFKRKDELKQLLGDNELFRQSDETYRS